MENYKIILNIRISFHYYRTLKEKCMELWIMSMDGLDEVFQNKTSIEKRSEDDPIYPSAIEYYKVMNHDWSIPYFCKKDKRREIYKKWRT